MSTQRSRFVPEAPFDVFDAIDSIIGWYLNLSNPTDPIFYERLVDARKKLSICRMYLSRHVADHRYLKDSLENKRKREMAKSTMAFKAQMGVTAAQNAARVENERNDEAAAAAAGAYEEANLLHDSLKDILIAIGRDISRQEEDYKYANFLSAARLVEDMHNGK